MATRTLDLGTGWRWAVGFPPRLLWPWGLSPWWPWDGRLGGPRNRSGRGGGKRDSQPLTVLDPLDQHY